jgi:peptidylprolyl isomerase
MGSIQKFWPLLVLLGVGVVALALIGLDTGKDGKSHGKEWEGEDVVALPSGLKYIDEQEGEGEAAKEGNKLTVKYTGRLADTQKVFDSTDKNAGEPFTFELGKGQVIKGWDEGVVGMKAGGTRKLLIPSKLGYGPRGSPPEIPPNADLEFDVELVKIEK